MFYCVYYLFPSVNKTNKIVKRSKSINEFFSLFLERVKTTFAKLNFVYLVLLARERVISRLNFLFGLYFGGRKNADKKMYYTEQQQQCTVNLIYN